MSSRRIALLGLSGVGKSTLVATLNKLTPVIHLQASALIKAEQTRRAGPSSASSEELRSGPVIDNQQLLIAAFQREAMSATVPIVFDAHSIIDAPDGIIEIPSSVFAALGLDAICFLDAAPEVIADRRQRDKTRERPLRDVEELGRHQVIAQRAAERIAIDICCPFIVFKDIDIYQIADLITGEPTRIKRRHSS